MRLYPIFLDIKPKLLIKNSYSTEIGTGDNYDKSICTPLPTIKGVKTINEFGTTKKKRSKRSRTRVYDERVDKALKQLWYIADGICGKSRMAGPIYTRLFTHT